LWENGNISFIFVLKAHHLFTRLLPYGENNNNENHNNNNMDDNNKMLPLNS
jgi:hypothetical protein